MSERKHVGCENTQNIMKAVRVSWYETLIAHQDDGKAKRYFIADSAVAAASHPPTAALGFELADVRSFVLVGNQSGRNHWSLVHESVVKREAFPRGYAGSRHTLRLIHLNSGTELYRTGLPVREVACGTGDEPAGWSAQIPAYTGAGLSVETLDRDNRVVFAHDLAGVEL